MRTEDLLEQCLKALSAGQPVPPDIARYLARHPDQHAEVEELLFVARRVSRMPAASMSPQANLAMQQRLARRLGFDPEAFESPSQDGVSTERLAKKRRWLPIARLQIPMMRPGIGEDEFEDVSEERVRRAFRDLTREDIRRYIGVRGEDYLYYRQALPGWEPVFSFIAFVLRGFKRLEKLASLQ